jgi:hypothetical protein
MLMSRNHTSPHKPTQTKEQASEAQFAEKKQESSRTDTLETGKPGKKRAIDPSHAMRMQNMQTGHSPFPSWYTGWILLSGWLAESIVVLFRRTLETKKNEVEGCSTWFGTRCRSPMAYLTLAFFHLVISPPPACLGLAAWGGEKDTSFDLISFHHPTVCIPNRPPRGCQVGHGCCDGTRGAV